PKETAVTSPAPVTLPPPIPSIVTPPIPVPVSPAAAPVPPAAIPPPAAPPPLAPPPFPPRAPPPARRPARAAIDWEAFMGVKLFAWVGGFVLFLSVVFFVKYFFDNNLITAGTRLALG